MCGRARRVAGSARSPACECAGPSAVTVGDKPPPLILVGTATHAPDDRARGSLASGLREGLDDEKPSVRSIASMRAALGPTSSTGPLRPHRDRRPWPAGAGPEGQRASRRSSSANRRWRPGGGPARDRAGGRRRPGRARDRRCRRCRARSPRDRCQPARRWSAAPRGRGQRVGACPIRLGPRPARASIPGPPPQLREAPRRSASNEKKPSHAPMSRPTNHPAAREPDLLEL